MTDFRNLIQRLTDELDAAASNLYFDDYAPDIKSVLADARAYLAQPEPQGPTDEEILALSESHNISYNCIDGRVEYPCREGYDMREDVLSYSRAVLARWGK